MKKYNFIWKNKIFITLFALLFFSLIYIIFKKTEHFYAVNGDDIPDESLTIPTLQITPFRLGSKFSIVDTIADSKLTSTEQNFVVNNILPIILNMDFFYYHYKLEKVISFVKQNILLEPILLSGKPFPGINQSQTAINYVFQLGVSQLGNTHSVFGEIIISVIFLSPNKKTGITSNDIVLDYVDLAPNDMIKNNVSPLDPNEKYYRILNDLGLFEPYKTSSSIMKIPD